MATIPITLKAKRFSIKGKDKVMWIAVDGDYKIDFKNDNNNPFKGSYSFTVVQGSQETREIKEGAVAKEYKYDMTVPTGIVVDPTIFIDL